MKIKYNVYNVVLSPQAESTDNACGDDNNLVMMVLSSLVLFSHISYPE